MIAGLLAAALAAPAAAAPAAPAVGPNDPHPYGILLLAYDVDVKWRQELGSLAQQLKGHAVESVTSVDQVSLQRAVDKLAAQHAAKIVAVPIETLSGAPWLDQARFLFGVRAEPARDVPDPESSDAADKKIKPPHAPSALKLPSSAPRLASPVPLELAPALDKSPLLVDILADRAKALSKDPAREGLVLVGIAPRSDAALKDWLTDAQDAASKIGAKAGFREALALGVREGVRADQQDKDRRVLRAAMRGLARKGRVVVVPLSPQAERTGAMFKKELGGFFAYRWDGRGVQGDRRLQDWIKASAEKAAALPDGRLFKNGAPGAKR